MDRSVAARGRLTSWSRRLPTLCAPQAMTSTERCCPSRCSTTRYIRAWEFLPGSSAVHHATMQFDPTRSSRHLDEQDPEPGYEGLVPHSAMSPDGYFLGLAARAGVERGAARDVVAASHRRRPDPDDAPQASGESRDDSRTARPVLQRCAAAAPADAHSDDPAAHGHRTRRPGLPSDRHVRSGRRRRPLHDSAARAPPREGDQELRDAARRHTGGGRSTSATGISTGRASSEYAHPEFLPAGRPSRSNSSTTIPRRTVTTPIIRRGA